MECKCGYKGLAEIGNFSGSRHGQHRDEIHFRCPKCKTFDFRWINEIDSVREALIFPTEHNHVSMSQGEASPDLCFYSIYNPSTSWGHSGTISIEEYNELINEFPQLKLKPMVVKQKVGSVE